MVQKRYPSSELLAAGWSLGGNILVRYLGEEGASCPISAAASLCNPLDLVSSFQAQFPGTPSGGMSSPACTVHLGRATPA